MSEHRWYVVQTNPRAEGKAADNLIRQGFSVYMPRYLKRRRHARKTETVATPLFPRYLFVAVDIAAQRWRSIHSTIGVANLICNGDAPAAMPDRIVDELKRRENESGFVTLEQTKRFVFGDKVRIVDGAFATCLGLFEGMRDSERVTVLLDLLGRKVRVVLDDLSVAAA